MRFFGLYTFFYFADPANQPSRKVPSFYSKSRFQVKSVHIRLMHETWFDKVVRAVQAAAAQALNVMKARLDHGFCRQRPASYQRICTLPLTCAVTLAMPASTGSDSSDAAFMAIARITGIAPSCGDSVFTATSRTV